jgi:hypothetical protein
MPALVSTSCAAVLDRFPLVASTWVHSDRQNLVCFAAPFKATGILHLFMHKLCKSEAQLTGPVLPATLLLLEQYQCTTISFSCYTSTESITTLRFAQRRKIALKIFSFLEGCRSSQILRSESPDHNSSKLFLIIHSDQATKLSKA